MNSKIKHLVILYLRSLLAFAFFLASLNPRVSLAQNPIVEWVNVTGSANYDHVLDITNDFMGNVYTVGYFSGTVDFDPGSGVSTLTSAGLSDVYIRKIDPEGEFVWARKVGGTNYDEGASIAIDPNNNVLITGVFWDSADLDPSSAIESYSSNGKYDCFLLKLSSSGNFMWAKTFGGSQSDRPNSISIDSNNTIYVGGTFESPSMDIDPGPAVMMVNSVGSSDIFLQKFNSNGDLLWANTIGGSNPDNLTSLCIDQENNIYATGSFTDVVDFDPSAGVLNLTAVLADIFVLKLDSQGLFSWAKSMGGSGNDQGRGIACDNTGGVYITGEFAETSDFDPSASNFNLTSNGSFDAFTMRLNAIGTFDWAIATGGSDYDFGKDITIGPQGGLFITGNFRQTVDFDPGISGEITSNGDWDVFIEKLDKTGSFLWVMAMGGLETDGGNALATDTDGNVYLCGEFEDSAAFNPSSSVKSIGFGVTDVFLLKISECNPIDILVELEGSTLTSLTAGPNYQWLDCSNNFEPIPDSTDLTFTTDITGFYAIEIINGICRDTSTCVELIVIGVDQDIDQASIILYPNPVANELNLKWNESISDVEIEIIDLFGRSIYKRNVNAGNQLKINEDFDAGSYFVSLKSSGGYSVIPFLKVD